MKEPGLKKDDIFAAPQQHIVDFAFDAAVAEVFPDMIRRSVPGYDTLITSLAVIAEKYFQNGTHVYDLGCSHGAATLATWSLLRDCDARYIAVDNSQAMVEHCKRQFARHMTGADVKVLQQDIQNLEVDNASVVIINLTLQFLPPENRQALLNRVYKGLRPGGVMILTEKVVGEEECDDALQIELYHHFKSANGYSDLEISQKRTALEKVMKLDSLEQHKDRLQSAGFSRVLQWFQCFNFISLIAIR